MDNKLFPLISESLLRELEKRFPDKAPSITETFEDLRWRGGQVSVIRFLRQQFEVQQQQAMEGPDVSL